MAASALVATGSTPNGRIRLEGERGVAMAIRAQRDIAVWNAYWLHVRSLLSPRGAANMLAMKGSTVNITTYSHPGLLTQSLISCRYATKTFCMTSPTVLSPPDSASGSLR